jgi:hypothetical protein
MFEVFHEKHLQNVRSLVLLNSSSIPLSDTSPGSVLDFLFYFMVMFGEHITTSA